MTAPDRISHLCVSEAGTRARSLALGDVPAPGSTQTARAQANGIFDDRGLLLGWGGRRVLAEVGPEGALSRADPDTGRHGGGPGHGLRVGGDLPDTEGHGGHAPAGHDDAAPRGTGELAGPVVVWVVALTQ